MIIDNKGKLFGKINIIDLAVILLVIVAAAGICLRFVFDAAENVRNSVIFSYTVEVEGIRI